MKAEDKLRLLEELEQLGAKNVQPGFCGASFAGDRTLLYRVNLWARLPFRILLWLSEFSCETGDDLYAGVQRIDWEQYLTPEQTLAVTATGKTDSLNHTHFTSLQVKNAIVQQQMDSLGYRSDVDTHEPDLRINVHLNKGKAT